MSSEVDLGREVLSSIIVHSKYAKYEKELNRRESWEELITRNKNMHIKKFPHLISEIEKAYEYVYNKEVLPSMRSLQFAGKALETNNIRMYNCSFLHVDSIYAFSETFFLLLSGAGVGISVQKHHIDKLPPIKKPSKRERKFVISDDIMGWADAVKALMKSYTGITTSTIIFDYSQIREKGSELVTSGGKAPGPEPLRIALEQIRGVLNSIKDNAKMRPFQAHRIMCIIAQAVLAGGIRRSSIISLFSPGDNEMLTCKTGNWWELYPELAMANNSVMLDREETEYKTFSHIFDIMEEGKAGEPGFSWTNNREMGFNPCHEVILRSNSVCNLVDINGTAITDQNKFNELASVAAFIATLQASYTDFHYLRDIWRETIEEDSLIGVGITGIANEKLLELNEEEAAEVVKATNQTIAKAIGINPAKRTTVVKPAGTTSLVLKTSSGIHAWHSDYYIRRMRLNKDESMYKYLIKNMPELIEDDFFRPETQAVFGIPIKAPKGAITRKESVLDLLERIKRYNINWIKNGTVEDEYNNNVSATVSVKDEEWKIVKEWMWVNRYNYAGISLLPFDGGTYKQAPFEEITKEKYEELIQYVKEINTSEIKEYEDLTDLSGEAACAGGACEVSFI